ncbi:helix-turn-helix domain containing protein [Modestobacter sp. VKM Ac-2977]|uniref:TetR/AcrR family transcriptional regulator n=1 Tax=Modestobacter sp. VKM Ac-2977 TaxID=3004131 RepID=UPI0022AA48A2|nr:TetR/AcrR family transcriptional regulator [Modestobacter sp. VKM Ac-2977]MCZ2820285.1 helix-turn-helix domain containing protein [Modestobacter sp. VKM Ac-2977]
MTAEGELPEDVALLWGLRSGGRRGRKPALTVEDITRAAVRLADAESLAAVSMARVASELGNSTMALYRHVRSKDELLLLMSDAALEEPPTESAPGEWREQLIRWAHDVLTMIRRHPWYRDIPISGPPAGPRNLAWLDRALAALAETALAEEEKLAVVMGLLPLVHGQARLSLDLSAGYAADPESFGEGYARSLARLVDPLRFPALSRVIAAGVFGSGGPPGVDGGGTDRTGPFDELDAEFQFALTCYLEGVAGFIARRAAG